MTGTLCGTLWVSEAPIPLSVPAVALPEHFGADGILGPKQRPSSDAHFTSGTFNLLGWDWPVRKHVAQPRLGSLPGLVVDGDTSQQRVKVHTLNWTRLPLQSPVREGVRERRGWRAEIRFNWD